MPSLSFSMRRQRIPAFVYFGRQVDELALMEMTRPNLALSRLAMWRTLPRTKPPDRSAEAIAEGH